MTVVKKYFKFSLSLCCIVLLITPSISLAVDTNYSGAFLRSSGFFDHRLDGLRESARKTTRIVGTRAGSGLKQGAIALTVSTAMLMVFATMETLKTSENQNALEVAGESVDATIDMLTGGEMIYDMALTGAAIGSYNLVMQTQIAQKLKTLTGENKSILRKFFKFGAVGLLASYGFQISTELFQLASLDFNPEEKEIVNLLGQSIYLVLNGDQSDPNFEFTKATISKLFQNTIEVLSNQSQLLSLLMYNVLRKTISSENYVLGFSVAIGFISGSSIPVIGSIGGTIIGLALGIGYGFLPYRYKVELDQMLLNRSISRRLGELNLVDYKFTRTCAMQVNRAANELVIVEDWGARTRRDNALEAIDRFGREFERDRQRYVDSLVARVYFFQRLLQEESNNEVEYFEDTVFNRAFNAILEMRQNYQAAQIKLMETRDRHLESYSNQHEMYPDWNHDNSRLIIQSVRQKTDEMIYKTERVLSQFDLFMNFGQNPENRTAFLDVFNQIYMVGFSEDAFLEL